MVLRPAPCRGRLGVSGKRPMSGHRPRDARHQLTLRKERSRTRRLRNGFKSLRNNHGLSCCEISDCRQVEACLANGYYEALIDNRWSRVPDETINNVKN